MDWLLAGRQEYYMQEGRHGYGSRGASKGPSTVNKIREALNLMRNQKFEVCVTCAYVRWTVRVMCV